jgi:adenylate kinase
MSIETQTNFLFTEEAMLSTSRGRVILFLGAPGSGKGTQSSRLSLELGLPSVSTGEILRAEAKENTPTGLRLRRLLASGSLVSDRTVCSVVRSRLTCAALGSGLILDGFPRTVRQAAWLNALLADCGLPTPTVLHLYVSRRELLRRLTARRQCAVCGAIYNLVSRPSLRGARCEKDGGALAGRDDDAEEVILRRLAEYDRMSSPLIEYYRALDYHVIDGEKNPQAIAADLLEIVRRAAPAAVENHTYRSEISSGSLAGGSYVTG